MHFLMNAFYIALLAIPTAALPRAQALCAQEPYIRRCGNILSHRCCTIEEWNELHASPSVAVPAPETSSEAPQSEGTLFPRSNNMMCRGELIGCGSRLRPRCCTAQEWNALYPDRPVPIPSAATTTTTTAGSTIYTSSPTAIPTSSGSAIPNSNSTIFAIPTGPLVPAITSGAASQTWPPIYEAMEPTPDTNLERFPTVIHSIIAAATTKAN